MPPTEHPTLAVTATLDPAPADRLSAALDYADPPFGPGDALPLAWHWMYFAGTIPRASQVGVDGRGAAGDIVPTFPGLSRMWAGGAFAVKRLLTIGEAVERRSRVAKIEEKSGRSGKLAIVELEHTLLSGGSVAFTERHDLVFRENRPYSGAAAGKRPEIAPTWRQVVTPDEPMLFRFSALTYNPHRIHYNSPYTTGVENYPGLVVHGPLTCILLLNLIRREVPGRRLATFSYRAQRPLFCGNQISICGTLAADGNGVAVWAEDHHGFLAMTGEGIFA